MIAFLICLSIAMLGVALFFAGDAKDQKESVERWQAYHEESLELCAKLNKKLSELGHKHGKEIAAHRKTAEDRDAWLLKAGEERTARERQDGLHKEQLSKLKGVISELESYITENCEPEEITVGSTVEYLERDYVVSKVATRGLDLTRRVMDGVETLTEIPADLVKLKGEVHTILDKARRPKGAHDVRIDTGSFPVSARQIAFSIANKFIELEPCD